MICFDGSPLVAALTLALIGVIALAGVAYFVGTRRGYLRGMDDSAARFYRRRQD